jgi:hypothetical protein
MSEIRTYSNTAGPVPPPGGPLSYVHWGPAMAGALVTAAVSVVLMSFASAIGLMVVSPSPTWRDTSVRLALLSGTWIIVATVSAFGIGGYLAGRVRSTWKTTDDEIDFRDGVHGLLVWAIGVVIGVAMLWASAGTILTMSGASSSPRDAAGTAALAYELDRLFRSERRLEPVAADVRAEATRLLMKGVGRNEIPSDDRTHLNRIVAGATGVQLPDAERRVVQVLAEVRNATSQTRRSAVVLGFAAAAGLAAAAAAAWFAAGAGGRHRDSEFAPPLRIGRVVVRTEP